MRFYGSCGRGRRGRIYRRAFRPTKPVIVGSRDGSTAASCRKCWHGFEKISKSVAGSATRLSLTGRMFLRKKGIFRGTKSCWQHDQGHGNRRPRWSSTRCPYCGRKPARLRSHRANSRRCFPGRTTSEADRRQSLGQRHASEAACRRARDRTDRAQARWQTAKQAKARWTFTAPVQTAMESRTALRMAQALETHRHQVGAKSQQLPRFPTTWLRNAPAQKALQGLMR